MKQPPGHPLLISQAENVLLNLLLREPVGPNMAVILQLQDRADIGLLRAGPCNRQAPCRGSCVDATARPYAWPVALRFYQPHCFPVPIAYRLL